LRLSISSMNARIYWNELLICLVLRKYAKEYKCTHTCGIANSFSAYCPCHQYRTSQHRHAHIRLTSHVSGKHVHTCGLFLSQNTGHQQCGCFLLSRLAAHQGRVFYTEKTFIIHCAHAQLHTRPTYTPQAHTCTEARAHARTHITKKHTYTHRHVFSYFTWSVGLGFCSHRDTVIYHLSYVVTYSDLKCVSAIGVISIESWWGVRRAVFLGLRLQGNQLSIFVGLFIHIR